MLQICSVLPQLIENGHLYLANAPLYRLSQGGKIMYARDDAHRERLLKTDFDGRGKVEVGRFKGLGEMLPAQLRETTMAPAHRTLLRVAIPEKEAEQTASLVESLMGRKPELRLAFFQDRAEDVIEVDV